MTSSFKVLHHARVYRGFLSLCKYQIRHSSFHGGWCEPVVRERLEGLSAVSVLPYDPVTDRVVLIEQFRVGAIDDPGGPWLLETIGGYRGPGESAPAVARRELEEEAGLASSELVDVGEFYVSPGVSSERIHLFCARVDAAAAEGIHGLPEEGEETRVIVMDVEEALQNLFSTLNSTSVLILMQWLSGHREQLQERWLKG